MWVGGVIFRYVAVWLDLYIFFFFKQKTAYDMRISDWSSDVCSSGVLVIDSAERIEAGEFVVIRKLLQAILPSDGEETEGAWRVVIVMQTQSWVEGDETILGGRKAHPVEVEALKSDAVKLAILPLPTLGDRTSKRRHSSHDCAN